jgi:hypothetical protein
MLRNNENLMNLNHGIPGLVFCNGYITRCRIIILVYNCSMKKDESYKKCNDFCHVLILNTNGFLLEGKPARAKCVL